MTEPSEITTKGKDFRTFRESHQRGGTSLWIGTGFVIARNAVARTLLALRITPNICTFLGLLATCGAGVCFALGAGHVLPPSAAAKSGLAASWWPIAGAAFIFLTAAFDMLDGAVARIGNLSSRFGGIWDSILDRGSDLAIFTGCAAYFTLVGNVTLVVLSFSAAGAALLTSYVKARAENVIERCGVGYWQRGERIAAVLIASCAGHLPVMLWMLGTSPWFTVLRRVRDVYAQTREQGQSWEPSPGLRKLLIWRDPRGTIGYDVVTGFYILILIVGPWIWPFLYGQTDPLGDWLRH